MLDRLISGAGAVADGADRSVRLVAGGSRGSDVTTPGSVLVAAMLVILAGMLVLAGLEATDPSTPLELTAAAVAASRTLPDRAFVSISGAIDATYVVTYIDENDDGHRDAGETADGWFYWLVDPVTRSGVTVSSERPPASILAAHPPEFTTATITGLLRREERTVDHARTVDGFDFGDLDLTLSDRYVLVDGAPPASAPLAFGLAGVLVAAAVTILVGVAGGYLIYRREPGPLPAPATTLVDGQRIPLRLTGLVPAPGGWIRVREAPGDLVRIAPDAEDAARLAFDVPGTSPGLRLDLAEIRRVSIGRVMTFRAPRPAIRIGATSGPLYLSFDSDAERDRAAAEVIHEAGLGPDGKPIEPA